MTRGKSDFVTVEGVVLRATPYKERSTILTLFTKEQGLMSCMAYTSHKKHHFKNQLISPLCHANFTLRTGMGMDTITDGAILSLQLQLRDSLEHLTAAGQMARVLYASQLELKPAPHLFQLFIKTLSEMRHHSSESILALFYTKLLIHEGAFSRAHPYCQLTHDEWALATHCATITSFSHCATLSTTPSFLAKIQQWALSLSQH